MVSVLVLTPIPSAEQNYHPGTHMQPHYGATLPNRHKVTRVTKLVASMPGWQKPQNEGPFLNRHKVARVRKPGASMPGWQNPQGSQCASKPQQCILKLLDCQRRHAFYPLHHRLTLAASSHSTPPSTRDLSHSSRNEGREAHDRAASAHALRSRSPKTAVQCDQTHPWVGM